jgi:uncharacterized membrane protein YiaA
VVARLSAVSDAAALVVFATVGLLSHDHTLSGRGYARDAIPFLACWFAAALTLRLYTSRGWRRLAATWAVGVPLGVLVRALILGRSLNGKEAAFLAVSLITIGVLVIALRLALRLLSRRARPAAP